MAAGNPQGSIMMLEESKPAANEYSDSRLFPADMTGQPNDPKRTLFAGTLERLDRSNHTA